MIEALISSKTRIKLLLKFFLNSGTSGYLRSLAGEFNESTNAIRLELNRLEKAGLLSSQHEGNKKIYQANNAHPLFEEIHNIVLKHFGIDHIIDKVIKRLGNVKEVYLTGEFARGLDSEVIDLLIVGDVDQNYLIQLIGKVEEMIQRKVRYLLLGENECREYLERRKETPALLLWSNEK
jgi:predicted nucleotidyltransferase